MPAEYKENTIFANRYRLKTFLGNGKYTEVWHAFDTLANVGVAIKLYLNDAAKEEVLRKFTMVFDINHSNILHPIYVGIHDGKVYEIMQFCKQGNVANLIAEGGTISEETCWKLLHDVAAGLSCLHACPTPILHLDIKPDNVLIQDGGVYALTDFGISEYFRGDKEKRVNGTVAYMAPERFMEDSFPVKASDIWSLGAMMYEVMTGGELPFGETGGSFQAPDDDAPMLPDSYSQEIKQIVCKCLAYYPWDRPVANNIVMCARERMKSENYNSTK